jgi:hypothetical protein
MNRIARLAALVALSATMALAKEAKQDARPSIDAEHTVTFTSTVKAVDQKTQGEVG